MEGQVAPGWDPPLINNRDRVARKGECYVMDFHVLGLGRMRLEAGRGLLTLRALALSVSKLQTSASSRSH